MKTVQLVACALLGGLYLALGLVFLPMAFGPVQLRVAEALTLLPVLSPIGIWGVGLGCFLTNLVGLATGGNICGPWDLLFGTGATLLAGWLSYRLRGVRWRGLPLASALPPVLVNAVVIGGELCWALTRSFAPGPLLLNMLWVAVGQLGPCLVLGPLLVAALEKKGLAARLFGPLTRGK